MVVQREVLEDAKRWVAASKARLSQEGLDIAMTVSDGDKSGDSKGGSVTVYAQTQSPDLFDETASTDGFVELTARATVWEQGDLYLEVLVAQTADTIREERRPLDSGEDVPGLLDEFCAFLKEKSYPGGRA